MNEDMLTFWDLNGRLILSFLKAEGIPWLDCEVKSQEDRGRYEVGRKLLQLGFPIHSSSKGITILQYRYKSRKGDHPIKTKWMSGARWLKEGQTLVACTGWIFLPMRIEPKKKSCDSKNQKYIYRMNLWEYAVAEGISRCAVQEIATSWDGSLLTPRAKNHGDTSDFPYKSAFPRAIVSKINRCLAKNFWPALWCDEDYFAWHIMDGNLAHYMGTRGLRPASYIANLRSMLEKDETGTAATLLAFTCFSVLKKFFPQYHVLQKNAPYLEAKKHMPNQIALCISGDPSYLAQRLVNLCCGCFYVDVDCKYPIVDGVSVQKIPPQITKLGENEYEAKVLQPSCILWINRQPEDSLLEDGRVINIQAAKDALYPDVELFSQSLLIDLTERISTERIEQFERLGEKIQADTRPLIEDFVAEIKETADKCRYSQDELNLDAEWDKLRRSKVSPKPLDILRILMRHARTNVRNEMENCTDVVTKRLDQQFSHDIAIIYKLYRTKIQRYINQNTQSMYSYAPDYEDALKDLKPFTAVVSQPIVSKFAFLWASVNIFTRLCISGQDGVWIRDKLHQGLKTAMLQQKQMRCATDVLAQYISNAIMSDRVARIRGEGSDRVDVCIWYDPHDRYFLLPSKRYFTELQPLMSNHTTSQRVFEQRLVDEGILYTVMRGDQMRRTFEVKLSSCAKREAVIKIRSQNLPEKFLLAPKIAQKLCALDSDPSPYRGHS